MLEINTRRTVTLVLRAIRNIVLFSLTGASLAACSSNLANLTSGSPSLAPSSSGLANNAQAAKTEQVAQLRSAKPISLAMSPIIGPPSPVAKKLTRKITGELKKRNINVTKGKAGYNMRGYLVSSSEGAGAKLAYIWDLNNKAGKRQTRIAGEKTVSGGKSTDPWGGVNDQILSSIASTTADQLAIWIIKKNGGVVNTAALKKQRARRTPSARSPATTASTSKNIPKPQLLAMVVPVTGAPGDGKTSLTKAIKKTLYGKGVRLTSKRTASVYQVRGIVQMGAIKGGKQPIRIDWRVYDPKGKRLGTVTQKNEIPKGSLNGKWGAHCRCCCWCCRRRDHQASAKINTASLDFACTDRILFASLLKNSVNNPLFTVYTYPSYC